MKSKKAISICLLFMVLCMIVYPVSSKECYYNFNNIKCNSAYINGYDDGYADGYNTHIVRDIRYNIYNDNYIRVDYNEYTGMFYVDTKYNLKDHDIMYCFISFVVGILFTFFAAFCIASVKN